MAEVLRHVLCPHNESFTQVTMPLAYLVVKYDALQPTDHRSDNFQSAEGKHVTPGECTSFILTNAYGKETGLFGKIVQSVISVLYDRS